jgi:hypothetical protein
MLKIVRYINWTAISYILCKSFRSLSERSFDIDLTSKIIANYHLSFKEKKQLEFSFNFSNFNIDSLFWCYHNTITK